MTENARLNQPFFSSALKCGLPRRIVGRDFHRKRGATVSEPIQSDALTPLRCRHCGSNRISVPARTTDESVVTCTDCGDEIGLWGEVRVGILDVAKKKPTAKTAAIARAMAQRVT
jgi:DNA-directed RNA polymerase subunit RPC12/RpoP